MADDKKRTRTPGEQKIDKAQRTTEEARAIIDAEGEAHRAKTARLKDERLAKQAAELKPKPVKAVRKSRARQR